MDMIYKGKATVWGVMLGITLLITWISSWNIFHQTEYTAFAETEHQDVKSFMNIDVKKATTSKAPSMEEAEIILKDFSEAELEGYIKYPGEFYSPIGLLVPSGALCDDSGFEKKKEPDGFDANSEIYINLKTILDAMEKDKTWGSLNFNGVFDKDEKVCLAIPDDSLPYSDQVKMLIRTALNDYSPDGLGSQELSQRLDAIIKKCKKYTDGPKSFAQKRVNDKKLIPILVPECEALSSCNAFHSEMSENNKKYILISLTKTYCIRFDMFLKKNDDSKHYDGFIESLETKGFYEDTGLRSLHSKFHPYKAQTHNYCARNISEIQIASIGTAASPIVGSGDSAKPVITPGSNWRQTLGH